MNDARMKYWFINALCGVAILFLLGMHMIGMHLDDLLALVIGSSTEPLGWHKVIDRGKSPVMTVSYVLLLGAALFHGFYGLHTLLTEFWSGRRAARLILIGCWSAGLLLFLTGTIATVSFHLLTRIP